MTIIGVACLLAILDMPPHSPIVGGEPASETEFGAAVYLRAGRQDCSAVMLSPTVGLTAAHCVAEVQFGQQVTVFHGATVVDGTAYQVARWGVSPNYCEDCADNRHDIAFIETTLAVEEVENVAVPIVAQDEWDALIREGQSVHAVGFGNGGMQDLPLERDQAELVIEEISRSGNELTLVPTRGSPCGGDSGGPMFARLATGDLRLVGVHSRSFGGCPNEQVVASTPYSALCWVRDETGLDVLAVDDPDCSALDTRTEGCGACASQPSPPSTWCFLLLGLLLGRSSRASEKSREH